MMDAIEPWMITSEPWSNKVLNTETLPLTKGDQHLEICKKLNETYRQKNADYGDSFGKLFDEYGELSAVIRLDDKLTRFKQLINKPAQVKNESKIDTALDAANYWIMTAMKLMEREENNG
jgi:hypothetical protein